MQLSEELAGRHAAVGRQQLERLDTCYCALAAAARQVSLAPMPVAPAVDTCSCVQGRCAWLQCLLQLDTRGCVLSTAAQQVRSML